MGAAPTSPARERDWAAYAFVPPPPTAPAVRPVAPAAPPPRAESEGERPEAPSPAAGHKFDAEMDATELDDLDRPTTNWTARGRRLSRSHMVFRSRRMSHPGRRVLLAVHMIDSEPVPLFGIVQTCDYDGEGQYLIRLDFMPIPGRPEVAEWTRDRTR